MAIYYQQDLDKSHKLCINCRYLSENKLLTYFLHSSSERQALNIAIKMTQIFAFITSLRAFQLLGLCPVSISKSFRPVEKRKFLILSLMQIALAIFIFLGVIIERDFYLNGRNNSVKSAVDFIQLIGIRIAHVIIIFESLLQYKELITFYSTLIDLDLAMKKVDVEINFKSERRKNDWTFFGIASFYVGVQIIYLVTLLTRKEFLVVGYWASYLFPYIVSCLRFYQLITCIWFIRRRFELLNAKLETIKLKNEIGSEILPLVAFTKSKFAVALIEECFFKYHASNFNKHNLKKNFEQLFHFRQMYEKLYRLTVNVNYFFGLSNLINIGNAFVAITSNCYFIFITLQNLPLNQSDTLGLIGRVFWTLPHIVNIFILSTVCHLTFHSVS